MFIESQQFLADSGAAIRHGFFGRRGGVSEGLFDSLNCGLGTSDDQEAVRENRRRTMDALSLRPDDLVTLKQIHSDKCLIVDQPWVIDVRPQADAMATDHAGIVLGILTADCAPVLFRGEKQNGKPVIAAAHAGWNGALKGILEDTVTAMDSLGASVGTIRAVIGPCIGPESYEVSLDFAAPFLAQDPANGTFFQLAEADDKLLFDLAAYAAYRLSLAGVPHVTVTGVDTLTGEADYFSFRRATHRAEHDYGRQLSVIAIAA